MPVIHMWVTAPSGTFKSSVQTPVTWTKDTDKDLLQSPLLWWLVGHPLRVGDNSPPKCTSGKGSRMRQLSHHPVYSQTEPNSTGMQGKTMFTSLSFTTSVLQDSTSSRASHPDAARRAVRQLMNGLCRGEERSPVCRRNVFVWAEKGRV